MISFGPSAEATPWRVACPEHGPQYLTDGEMIWQTEERRSSCPLCRVDAPFDEDYFHSLGWSMAEVAFPDLKPAEVRIKIAVSRLYIFEGTEHRHHRGAGPEAQRYRVARRTLLIQAEALAAMERGEVAGGRDRAILEEILIQAARDYADMFDVVPDCPDLAPVAGCLCRQAKYVPGIGQTFHLSPECLMHRKEEGHA